MTPQEEQLLHSLIDRINQTTLQEKDPEAETLLNQGLAGNPDALYMLAQTVLVQNIALDRARAQISQLQQQMQPKPQHATSFLGRLLGERDDPPTAGPTPQFVPAAQQPGVAIEQQAPSPGYQQVPPQYAPPPPQSGQPYGQYGPPQYPQTQYVPAGGQPSFLSGAMQTAAGVAAGALAFEGVESILHGFGHGGGWGGPGYGVGGFGERPAEETVINNYYDQPGGGAEHGEHHAAEQGQQFTDTGYDPRNNDPNDNLRGFDDQNASSANDQDQNAANDVSDFADQASFDNQSADDGGSGFDDSGSFDDAGGGFDDGGGGGGF